jgi:hypothetical protein
MQDAACLSMKCVGCCPRKPHFHEVESEKIIPERRLVHLQHHPSPSVPRPITMCTCKQECARVHKDTITCAFLLAFSFRHFISMAFWLVLPLLALHHAASLLSACRPLRYYSTAISGQTTLYRCVGTENSFRFSCSADCLRTRLRETGCMRGCVSMCGLHITENMTYLARDEALWVQWRLVRRRPTRSA